MGLIFWMSLAQVLASFAVNAWSWFNWCILMKRKNKEIIALEETNARLVAQLRLNGLTPWDLSTVS